MTKYFLVKIAYIFALSCILGITMSGARAADNATFNSQDVPNVMTAGQTYGVIVSMQNTGTTTWRAGSIKLGSSNPQDNMTWGVGRVVVLRNMAPGTIYGFGFQVTAPSTPGTYNFQWRMLEEGVQWFGSPSQNLVITVVAPTRKNDATVAAPTRKNDARFESQSVPTSMLAGQVYPISVTMTNTGNTTWTPGGGYRLGTENSSFAQATRVQLTRNVEPGQSYTFNFNVIGPPASHPLNYYFQGQMVEADKEWFGSPTPKTLIRVDRAASPPSLSFDCSNTTPTVYPSPASARCGLYNSGETPTRSISYSTIAGTTISGPTGACAAHSVCGVATVTASGPGTYNGTLIARPDTGDAASVSINLTVTGQAVDTAPAEVTWNALIDAFNHGDKSRALSYFATPEKYDPIFSSIGGRLKEIPATLSKIQLVEIGSNYATGVTDQTDSSGTVSQHYVSFIYKDGSWLIVDF